MLINKITALIPLLGWFYLSIIGIFLVSLALGKLFKPVLRLIFFGFALYALFLTGQAFLEEWQQFSQERKYFFAPFEQKNTRDKGNYYQIYYQYFRPQIAKKYQVLNYVDNSTQEFLFVRMYLYPTVVIQTPNVESRQSPYVLTAQDLLRRKGVGKVVENYQNEKFILDASQPVPPLLLKEK